MNMQPNLEAEPKPEEKLFSWSQHGGNNDSMERIKSKNYPEHLELLVKGDGKTGSMNVKGIPKEGDEIEVVIAPETADKEDIVRKFNFKDGSWVEFEENLQNPKW